MYSLVIPVYLNEGSVPEIFERCEFFAAHLPEALEVVFVNDASPDRSYRLLSTLAESRAWPFQIQFASHSRNFGSFAAIRTGLRVARGKYIAMMAADLQEPRELILSMFDCLAKDACDIALAVREGRDDPFFSSLNSRIFWACYRRFVQSSMPIGGVDVFGCNNVVKRALLAMEEANTSLVGQLIWVGYRRIQIPYTRLKRRHGKSAWSFRRKITYFLDSIFSFSDLPVRMLLVFGILGILAAGVSAIVIVFARVRGEIEIPGYASLAIYLLAFSSLNCLGLGIIGSYVWRAYENTKRRPEVLLTDRIE